MDNVVLITFLIFWTLHMSRRFLYYIYLWQLKSYRMDRLLEEISRNKMIFLPKVYIIASLILLILAVAIKEKIFYYSLTIVYLLFGFYSLFLLAKKKWRIPVFTKKIIAIIATTMPFGVFAIYYFSSNRNFFIPAFEILLPVFAFAFLFFLKLPAIALKKYTTRKARIKREEFKNLLVIGITGSYGKTSTKEFLYSILVQKYGERAVLKTEKNLNTEIGIALAILNDLNADHKFFICEMGAYKMGEIRESCQISRPRIGILTGINEQHMAIFGSQENIIKGKYELIESLPPDGMAFFNVKSKYCAELYDKTSN